LVKRRTNFGQKNHQFWSKERPQLVSKKLELTTGILSEVQKRTTCLPSHLSHCLCGSDEEPDQGCGVEGCKYAPWVCLTSTRRAEPPCVPRITRLWKNMVSFAQIVPLEGRPQELSSQCSPVGRTEDTTMVLHPMMEDDDRLCGRRG